MSRDAILSALRAAPHPEAPLPEPIAPKPAPPVDELCERFEVMLAAAGGVAVRVASVAGLDAALEALPVYRDARRRCSLVAGAVGGHFVLDDVEDPHALADVDFALLAGELGVAESGAVWIHDRGVRHRVILHVAEHVGLVVQCATLVADLHDAYAKIDFSAPGFGCFVSGPSKTADIEQALVIGAHGPRSLHVFLVG